jgi:hypothetical protein
MGKGIGVVTHPSQMKQQHHPLSRPHRTPLENGRYSPFLFFQDITNLSVSPSPRRHTQHIRRRNRSSVVPARPRIYDRLHQIISPPANRATAFALKVPRRQAAEMVRVLASLQRHDVVVDGLRRPRSVRLVGIIPTILGGSRSCKYSSMRLHIPRDFVFKVYAIARTGGGYRIRRGIAVQ